MFARLQDDLDEEARIRGSASTAPPKALLTCLAAVGGIEFSVVVPNLWFYIKELHGNVQDQLHASLYFTITMTFAKLAAGTLSDHIGFRKLYLWSTILGAAGGLTYATARIAGGIPSLLLGRLLGGAAAMTATLANAYTVRAIPATERAETLANIAAANLVGNMVGPAVTPLWAHVRFQLGGLLVDANNLPGLLVALAFALFGSLLLMRLREPPPPTKSHDDTTTVTSIAHHAFCHNKQLNGSSWFYSVLLSYSLSFIFALVLHSTVPVIAVVTEAEFGWGAVQNALAFLGLALFSLIGVLASGRLLKSGIDPIPIQFIASILLLLHELSLRCYERSVFSGPFAFLLWLGSLAASYALLSGTVAASLAAAVDPNHSGLFMGLWGFVESLGGISGPLLLEHGFGAGGVGGEAMAQILTVSRGALAVPTACLVVGYAVYEWRRWMQDEGKGMV